MRLISSYGHAYLRVQVCQLQVWAQYVCERVQYIKSMGVVHTLLYYILASQSVKLQLR